jgi:hypothetical protein
VKKIINFCIEILGTVLGSLFSTMALSDETGRSSEIGDSRKVSKRDSVELSMSGKSTDTYNVEMHATE